MNPPNTTAIAWQRSQRCDNGACVEIALHDGDVVVRDSKDPEGPTLRFTRVEWEAFEGGIATGEIRLFN